MSMLNINRDTLQKLTHESAEIRLRTLDQIANKLERALALNEKVNVKSVELCKQLIRWFGFTPIRAALKVLQLLKEFLQSPEHGEHVIKRLGAERIRKELRKIQILLENQTQELKILHDINEILKVYEFVDKQKDTDHDDVDEVISIASRLTLHEQSQASQEEFNSEDYELPWSSPSTSDYTSMKFMADILINKIASIEEVHNALLHLQLTMSDYPAEYMLQAPHIFRNLLQVYSGEIQTIETSIELVASTMLEFLNALQKRLECRRKSLYFPFSSQSTGDTKTPTPTQLKVSKALSDLLVASISNLKLQAEHNEAPPNVWLVIYKILHLYESLKIQVNICHTQKLERLIASVVTRYSETEQCTRVRLYHIQLVFLLQYIAQTNALYKPLHDSQYFETILRDYSIKCLYPLRHKQLRDNLCKTNKSLNDAYLLLESYEKYHQMAVKLLIGSNLIAAEVIDEGLKIALILDKLQSKHLVDILFNNLFQANPQYIGNNELKDKAIDLIIKLLNMSFRPLQIYAYERLMSTFKRHLGCLMNGETFIKECSNSNLLEAGIIGLPMNSKLLLNIANNSFECAEERIQKICCKLFELILQSPSLFGSKWSNFVLLLFPILPLLSCCCFSKKIMDLLMKLYHPDARRLPYVSVLQGNVAFLFHSESERRSEALTRLVFTINSLKCSDRYMPNLLEISDTLPNDICLLTAPREYHHIFSDRYAPREDAKASLNNLFQLLDSPDVEPLIRKTSLMQINVLCSNWQLTGELCNAGANYLILKALENSLQHECSDDYPDTVIPAISILCKILLYDSSVRCELSETPNIYVLLLRSVMMFNHDIQLRQDASICLFLLIFANQLVATENHIEGPLIIGNLQMPLNVQLRAAITSNKDEENAKATITSVFSSPLEETQYWRFVIAEASFNGLSSITHKSNNNQLALDIKEELKLTNQDIRIIRATQPGVSLKRLVKAASNATDHRSLIQACSMLRQQFLIVQLPNTFSVDSESSTALSSLLNKYLQLQPSNANDLELYEHLLEVLKVCWQVPLDAVVVSFIRILHKDMRHAFITMLTQKEEIPLVFYYKISKLLGYLIRHFKDDFERTLSVSESSIFFGNLFDLLMERCLQLFEIRDLQRVRCLLSVMVAISACHLDMSDKLLLYYCRRFLQLSVALKSFTQTGSQWHRDCLLAILQLLRQMQDGKTNFRLTPGPIKYLSGLCGHNDAQVRAFVWSILYVSSQTNAGTPSESAKENKSSDCSGAEMLVTELSYLPGGFMACCLSTFLDDVEVIWVRQVAGQLFANLINKQNDIEKIEHLLEQHYFVRSAGEALSSNVCVLSKEIPNELDPLNTQITTCELISGFTQICIEMSLVIPVFLDELCTRSFMFKLYEVLKQPPPSDISNDDAYIDMVSDICRLYTMCYENNFIFLQRTICRDPIWIDCYCNILCTIVAHTLNAPRIVDMLQLLMILFKDETALEHLSTKLTEYGADMVKLFQHALSISQLNRALQRCVLSALSLLCIKTQPEISGELSDNILLLLDGENITLECKAADLAENKENRTENTKTKTEKSKKAEVEAKATSSAISEHLCIALIRLFAHLYPMKVCKFTTAPSECQQQVVETLSLLLKVSPNAQQTAQNLKLHEQVICIYKHFFEEFATTTCSTFVKRHGEIKKLTVVKNLQLLFKFLLNWHSAPTMTTSDDMIAAEYSRIIIQIWPWLGHSGELKLTVLKVSMFLCERSLVICKRFSTINSSAFAHSVLQLTTKLIAAETLKVKASSTDCFPIISAGLRVMMNCCCCVEGRNALNKAHVMDTFDSLYPLNPKATRLKTDISNAWLEFWELFSRYEEGASVQHLNALCGVISRSKCQTRLLSLRILRNMAFLNSNRTKLLNSTDFIYTINEVVSQPLIQNCSAEEQLIVCIALWRLISGGVKFAAMIRGTKLSKHLRVLSDSLKCLMDEKNEKVDYGVELLQMLENIFNVLNN